MDISPAELESLAANPETQAALSAWKEATLAGAAQDIAEIAAPLIAANPTWTTEQLEPAVEDAFWHSRRHKWGWLGFMVDILRNVPSTESAAKAFVAAVLVGMVAGGTSGAPGT